MKPAISRLQNHRRVTHLLLLSLLFWIPAIIFLKLAEDVHFKEVVSFDGPVRLAIIGLRENHLTVFMRSITDLGSPFFIISTSLLAITYLLYRGRETKALFVFFAIGGAGIANIIMKFFFQRLRPDLLQALVKEQSFSFPSGHAMGTAAVAITILLLFWRTKWRWPVAVAVTLYTVLIGVSRVYLGVHFPSDVIAGWCASIIWVLLVYKIIQRTSHAL